MEQPLSEQTVALIKQLLYEEATRAQETGLRGEISVILDAINELNYLLDREHQQIN